MIPPPHRYFLKRDRAVVGGTCPSYDTFIKVVTRHPDFNVYFNINETGPGVTTKAASNDVTGWNHILIDIDPTSEPLEAFQAGAIHGILLRLWPELGRATSSVFSGRGYQLWIGLEHTPVPNETFRMLCERAISGFYSELSSELNKLDIPARIDFSCSDLGRVARCPGTINQKSGLAAHFLVHGETRVSPAQILQFAQPLAIPVTQIYTGEARLSQLLPHMSARAAQFLTEGLTYPGRHAGAYAAARSLLELGLDPERTRALIIKGGMLCRPQLTPRECSHIVTSAEQKGGIP